MEHFVFVGDLSLVSVFLWHFCFVYLIVLMLLSYGIYKNVKDRLFLTYFTYVALLFTYILCRNYYFPEILSLRPVFLYSYYIQVIYLCAYFHFGISVLNFWNHYPGFTRWVYRFIWTTSGIATGIFLLGLLGWLDKSYMRGYYFYFFFPLCLGVSSIIIYRSFRLKQEKQRFYFLIGTILFIVLGTAAVVTSIYNLNGYLITRISFFYLAIILECTFFAVGLGLRVRSLYDNKLDAERRLVSTQQELQRRMEEQIRQQEKDNLALQREKELQTLATQVALLENKVLRSQMNSHFIFNVLNAIKAYIIERDVKQAINYLNKFAKLMRKILDGSRSEQGSLAEELLTIKLYLEVEKMRLPDELIVDIRILSTRDLASIPFPHLLLQPFVENAIWHGLMPSDKSRNLSVVVNDAEDEVLLEIVDNGIGYTNSLKSKQDKIEQISHGISIIEERIELFNEREPLHRIEFGISDRAPQGTRVWISVKSG